MADRTTPGIGPGSWDSGTLARAQEASATNKATVYRIYTERTSVDLLPIVHRYFDGCTLIHAIGSWQGVPEVSQVIEVIATRRDLQRIFDLAGDIRVANYNQTCVIVTWSDVSRFDITEDTINNG